MEINDITSSKILSTNWQRSGKFILGILLGAIGLYLAFRDISFKSVWTALIAADVGLVLLAVFSIFVTLAVNAARWQLLFYPRHRELRWGYVFMGLVIGQMVNIVVPARLGELARTYFVGQSEEISKSLTLSTVVVEKVLDVITMLVFFAVMLPLIAQQIVLPAWLQRPDWWLFLACGIALLGIVLAAIFEEQLLILFIFLTRFLPERWRQSLTVRVRDGLAGLRAMRDWRVSLIVGILSGLTWLLAASTNYIMLRAMHISVSLFAAPFVLMVIQAGVAIPAPPGKIGVFHWLTSLALSVFAIERDIALSYAVLLHLVAYLPKIVLGGIFVFAARWNPFKFK